MKDDITTYVGLDVHKESIVAAYALGLGEVQSLGNGRVREREISRLCSRMQSKGSRVCFVYEAGPCGYGLYRSLVKRGFECLVCAPSLIPRKPGDQVKSDRRDAIKLAPIASSLCGPTLESSRVAKRLRHERVKGRLPALSDHRPASRAMMVFTPSAFLEGK